MLLNNSETICVAEVKMCLLHRESSAGQGKLVILKSWKRPHTANIIITADNVMKILISLNYKRNQNKSSPSKALLHHESHRGGKDRLKYAEHKFSVCKILLKSFLAENALCQYLGLRLLL